MHTKLFGNRPILDIVSKFNKLNQMSRGLKLDGVCREYYESGQIMCKDTYKNGERIKSKKYNTKGELISNQGD